ncbi:hypothetical protein DR79_1320 [Francisella tularensis]|uniref:Uncharacterized protein n=1 Tax=Francisella tularensis TaxID=263 RepID=A0AAW3D476_FRATU|nr:hypothetical protein FTH_0670 [Francisella tularensis subsp. holarctica OSU18]ADA79028.1 hypothetical protein NE061598_07745 [Francisella tularensis subsp. tularensis NE061598]KFJ39476.1 hypothetical protein DR85_846 [Francisella tularensis]KFJ39787.1 hypothetical protein DR87_262 [Francisella tularensis]KFJ44085.1 hypothetical protein DR79_1320 [Francisella tularensis]
MKNLNAKRITLQGRHIIKASVKLDAIQYDRI